MKNKRPGATTAIEWTDETLNPFVGCTKVSDGCRNCYAIPTAARVNEFGNAAHYEGVTRGLGADAQWTGEIHFSENALARVKSIAPGKRVFVNSMSDFWHENAPAEFRRRTLTAIRSRPDVAFQVLTKRSENVAKMIRDEHLGDLPENFWLGATVESGKYLERAEQIAKVKALVRFLSCEPLVGPVDLDPPTCPTCWGHDAISNDDDPTDGTPYCREHGDEMCFNAILDPCAGLAQPGINWVIVGGESGTRARPMHLEWMRDIVRQCLDASVPVFVKQMGRWPLVEKREATSEEIEAYRREHPRKKGRLSGHESYLRLKSGKGGDMSEWPEEFRVRQFPEAYHERWEPLRRPAKVSLPVAS